MLFVVRQRQPRNVERIQNDLADVFGPLTVGGRTLRMRVHHNGATSWRPPIEVYETDDALVVLAEVAGLRDADIEVILDEDVLSIRGDRQRLCDEPQRSIHEMGILYGPFAAEIYLPFAVDQGAVDASYTDGLLRVRLPKPPRTRIRIGGDAS